MKRFFTSSGLSMAFITGAHIPCFGHDFVWIAILLKIVFFGIGFKLLDVYGKNYWKWINNE